MTLSINPLAKLVSSVSESVSDATNAANGALANFSSISKADLDSTINRLSGGIGSGLNGATAGLNSLGSGFSDLAGNAQSALGGITSGAQSLVAQAGNALPSMAGVTGAIGSVSNIGSNIAGSINKLTGGSGLGVISSLSQLAGQISAAAGSLNNILSLKRALNLPTGAQLFSNRGSTVTVRPGMANDWRVRIGCPFETLFRSSMFQPLVETNGVVWPYLPNITISTKASYNTIEPIHSNFPFQSYKNSQVEDIQISGEFSCETEKDAAYWIAATTFFRTATKMFYGQGEYAGNPPIICTLNGYGASVFNTVPVIIKGFSVELKDDVNYVNCNTFGTNTWVPVLSTITVTVSPIYNRERLRKFSLQDFARGKTVGFI